jgi:hypothetical protein
VQSRNSTISALALSADGTKLYVGLSDGQLEEHRIIAAQSGAYLSLTARRHISKKVRQGQLGRRACRHLAVPMDML